MKMENIPQADQIKFEKIFERRAIKNMVQFELKGFKKVFPRLYKTIIESMNESSKNQ